MSIIKTKLRRILLFAIVPALVPAAMAVKINGSIAFDGTTILNDTIEGATAFLSFANSEVSVDTQTGDYVGVANETAVTINPLFFDPFAPPTSPFWSFSAGGLDYSFNLNSILSVERTALGGGLFQLTVAGLGIASITGFEDTAGAFSVTTTGDGISGSLGFGAFTYAKDVGVPDGGSAAALLGLGLLGFGLAQRKLKRNALAHS